MHSYQAMSISNQFNQFRVVGEGGVPKQFFFKKHQVHLLYKKCNCCSFAHYEIIFISKEQFSWMGRLSLYTAGAPYVISDEKWYGLYKHHALSFTKHFPSHCKNVTAAITISFSSRATPSLSPLFRTLHIHQPSVYPLSTPSWFLPQDLCTYPLLYPGHASFQFSHSWLALRFSSNAPSS